MQLNKSQQWAEAQTMISILEDYGMFGSNCINDLLKETLETVAFT